MKRRIVALSLVIMLLPFTALAQEVFTKDVAAINEAVKSVLLLEVYDADEELIATGSGFVAFNNRTVVTNHHVIKDADMIMAYSDDGYSYIVDRVFAADEKADIALLGFFSPTNLAPLPLGTESQALRAEPIVAIGSPKGLINTVSLGNVSAVFSDDGISYIQFTAPISSGSSGGPLFNDQGEVIGVTSASYDDGEGIVQNLNFAVGIDEAEKLFAEVDEKNAVSLEEYNKGMRPGATPTPAPTTKPTPTAQPTASPTPKPTASPTPEATIKPTEKTSRITDVFVRDGGNGKYEVTWSDQYPGSFNYFIAYKDAYSNNAESIMVSAESMKDEKVSATIIESLTIGTRYIFAVDMTEKGAKQSLLSGAAAQNTCTFWPQSSALFHELKRGDQGPDVVKMQQALIRLGYLDGTADGIYGSQTEQAVYDFKEANRLPLTNKNATSRMLSKLYGSTAVPFSDLKFALAITQDCYAQWDYASGDMLRIRFQVTNIAKKKTAKAFELYVYATDVWGKKIYGTTTVYYATTTKKVAPGKTVYSDYMYLPDRSKIDQIHVGVNKIVYTDGTVVEADWVDYVYWTID